MLEIGDRREGKHWSRRRREQGQVAAGRVADDDLSVSGGTRGSDIFDIHLGSTGYAAIFHQRALIPRVCDRPREWAQVRSVELGTPVPTMDQRDGRAIAEYLEHLVRIVAESDD